MKRITIVALFVFCVTSALLAQNEQDWMTLTKNFDKSIQIKKIRVDVSYQSESQWICVIFSTLPKGEDCGKFYGVNLYNNKYYDGAEDRKHSVSIKKEWLKVDDNWYEYEFDKPMYFYQFQKNADLNKVKVQSAPIDFVFNYSNDGTAELVSDPAYHRLKGKVVIPETVTHDGMEYKVTKIGDNAFSFCSDLESIVLPVGLKEIHTAAFRECKKLSNIELPNTLEHIGDYAFMDCVSLNELVIPNSVTKIEKSAFSHCMNLENVTLPNSITEIADGIFNGCGFTSLIIPDSVKRIGEKAFFFCESLRKVQLPNSLVSIGNSAFYGCESLEEINIPESVTEIGNEAFRSTKFRDITVENKTLQDVERAQQAAQNKRRAQTNDGSDMTRAKKLMAGSKYLDKSFTLSKDASIIILDGQSYNLGDETVKATLEVIPFGTAGNTIILDIDVPGAKEQGITTAYSWSGKNVHLAPVVERGSDVYQILRGTTLCGALSRTKLNDGSYVWGAIVNADNSTRTVSDIQKGMTKTEIESMCAELGLSKFKLLRQSGDLKIYGLYWVDLQKQYNLWGTDYRYQVRNDKLYGEFYFNAQEKLVKWFVY